MRTEIRLRSRSNFCIGWSAIERCRATAAPVTRRNINISRAPSPSHTLLGSGVSSSTAYPFDKTSAWENSSMSLLHILTP